MERGRTALVTGAANGIGRATCQRLLDTGWSVLAADRDEGAFGWAAGLAGLDTIVADVASPDDNARMAAAAEASFGALDAVILNAGTNAFGAIDTLPWADFERAVAVNMAGPVLGIRATLPLLRRRQRAAIVVTASIMGVGGDPHNWAYGMTKHAVIGLVRSLARELGHEGIRINALCPGLTKTLMAGAVNADGSEPAHLAMMNPQVPLQRWADPDEMASAIEFLVSDASSYVNGHSLVADGGASVGTGLGLPLATSAV